MSFILGVSSAVPDTFYFQEDVAKKLMEIFSLSSEKRETLNRIYRHSSIHKRHSVIDDFHKSRQDWEFWGSEYPKRTPGMGERNLRYKKDAPKLAEAAAKKLLDKWGGDRSKITHLISVTCTGVIAPGIEFYLMENLGLSRSLNRLGINFMGCFGAFKGLSVAFAFAQANPDARILLVCTELCSLHMHGEEDHEAILANSLFSDGSAVVLIGGNPREGERPLREIVRVHSFGFHNSMDKMSWEASDSGFRMRLCHTVPVVIKRHMLEFAGQLLGKDVKTDKCDWAIHPGGTSIIQAIEKSLQLSEDQTVSSWNVLRDYGNMSSATFLFVLEDLFERESEKEKERGRERNKERETEKEDERIWTAGVGFGPGLSAEGILLKKVR